MAVVKAPALSLDASGNLGGICYSRWRGLSIAKDPWTGTVPNTSKQQTIQNYLTSVSQAWGGTLTATQRSSWDQAAREIVMISRRMHKYVPTGYQYFMQLNMQRKRMSLSIMTLPPTAPAWAPAFYFGGSWNAGLGACQVNLQKGKGLGDHTGYGTEYWNAGPYTSGGRKPTPGEWRFGTYKRPPTYWTDYPPVTGEFWWYKARQIEEFGRVGNWFYIQIECV